MSYRLHRNGRFRRWLGARFGGDEALGDRLWRRLLHAAGATSLVYFLVPTGFFVVAPKEVILLSALVAVLVLEVLRHAAGLELPTLRAYEERRIGSYVFYAIALTGAILLFPLPIATTVVLGTSLVDPLAGELRASPRLARLYPSVPLATYGGFAFVSFAFLGLWPWLPSAGLALLAAAVAIAVEWPKVPWVDDDLAMTFVPALALYAVAILVLRLPA